MVDSRQVSTLAALLAPAGRLGSSGEESARARAAELAREICGSRPSLAVAADAVSSAIRDGGAHDPLGLSWDAVDDASEARFEALRQEFQRVPDGSFDVVFSAFRAVLRVHLDGVKGGDGIDLYDAARVGAAVAAATSLEGGRLLFVQGRLTGLRSYAFGDHDASFVPRDLIGLVGRSYRLAALEGVVRRRFTGAADVGSAGTLLSGGGRFLLLAEADDERARRIAETRAAIERELLRRYEGQVGVVVSTWTAAVDVLRDGRELWRSLGESDAARARTPFLDALADDGALGPFGDGMSAAAALSVSFDGDRALGRRLRGARFALIDDAGGDPVPLLDEDALAHAAEQRPDDVLRVEWPGSRDGLRGGLSASHRCGGRILLDPSPVLPVQSEIEDRGPMAAVHLHVDAFEPGGADAVSVVGTLSRARRIDEIVRLDAAAIAKGRSMTVLHGAAEHVIACGPLRAVLLFVTRLQDRVRVGFGEEARVSAGVAVTPRDRTEPDVARLVRRAKTALAEAKRAGGGWTSLLGVSVPSVEIGNVVALGDDLTELAAQAPGPVFALLEAALRLGAGGEDLPLSSVERLRGAVHDVAARFGVQARHLRDGSESDPPEIRALKTLIRNIGLIDTGVARAPLSYAVLLSQAQESRFPSEVRP